MVWAFLSPMTNILMAAALFVKLHLLASLLKQWMYVVRNSFSFGYISIKWDMEVWISELQIFNHNKSLISSQDLPDMIASIIKVHVKPLKTDISCSKEFVRLVCLWAEHSVCIMFYHIPKGFSGCWWNEWYRQSLLFSFYAIKGFQGLSFLSLNLLT